MNNRRNCNVAVTVLAAAAREAFDYFHALDADADVDPARLEEAALTLDAIALALAWLPATGTARDAKARAAALVLAPTAEGVAVSYVERALAASVVRDSIAAASLKRAA